MALPRCFSRCFSRTRSACVQAYASRSLCPGNEREGLPGDLFGRKFRDIRSFCEKAARDIGRHLPKRSNPEKLVRRHPRGSYCGFLSACFYLSLFFLIPEGPMFSCSIANVQTCARLITRILFVLYNVEDDDKNTQRKLLLLLVWLNACLDVDKRIFERLGTWFCWLARCLVDATEKFRHLFRHIQRILSDRSFPLLSVYKGILLSAGYDEFWI